jgi:NNP family nitrate/nitrite transporter-like MFS transporter
MDPSTGKATRIRLLDFSTPHMRAFHMSWIAFFVCFFAWFAIAPLMAQVRREMNLTAAQIGNIIVASVSITILARLLVGWLCDRYGPRLTYTWLLILGSLPVMGIGLATDYQSFLLFRLAIGAVGASFVITQYHTSVMFARNCVGTANATTAGWGNMGGGAAQLAMPLLCAGLLAAGVSEWWSWRLAMLIPGIAMLIAGVMYHRFTQDLPEGSVAEVRRAGGSAKGSKGMGSLLDACRDGRVWALALVYAACFGIEITIHNVAALYLIDSFGAGVASAGAIVGVFGLLAIFARTLGGYVSDRVSLRFGLSGRAMAIGVVLLLEGILLILLSRAASLPLAAGCLILFGLFVHMSCGATYAMIPFVNPRSIGSVAGVVGAGGNVGAVLSGLLFRGGLAWSTSLLVLGVAVTACSCLALLVTFAPQSEADELPPVAEAASGAATAAA